MWPQSPRWSPSAVIWFACGLPSGSTTRKSCRSCSLSFNPRRPESLHRRVNSRLGTTSTSAISPPGAAYSRHGLPPCNAGSRAGRFQPGSLGGDLGPVAKAGVRLRPSQLVFLAGGVDATKGSPLGECSTPSVAECSVAVERLANALPSRDLGPEDAYLMGEAWVQLQTALGNLRERTSAKTYGVFWRRFFWRQSVKEIVAALDLSSHEVRCRYHRVRRKWRELTKGLAVLGHNVDVPTQPNSPLPRKPR